MIATSPDAKERADLAFQKCVEQHGLRNAVQILGKAVEAAADKSDPAIIAAAELYQKLQPIYESPALWLAQETDANRLAAFFQGKQLGRVFCAEDAGSVRLAKMLAQKTGAQCVATKALQPRQKSETEKDYLVRCHSFLEAAKEESVEAPILVLTKAMEQSGAVARIDGTGKEWHALPTVQGCTVEGIKAKGYEPESELAAIKDLLTRFPDVRQPNRYFCGAAATTAVLHYFGFTDKTQAEVAKKLGTTVEESTHPSAIVDYLSELGLQVEARHNMTLDDLDHFTRQGMPVICCIQDWGTRREEGASFAYGHWITVLHIDDGCVFCQDSSVENAAHEPGGDVPKSEAVDSGNIAAPGRVVITQDKWMECWHDEDVEGNKFIRFGIVVGPPVAAARKSVSTVHPCTVEKRKAAKEGQSLDDLGGELPRIDPAMLAKVDFVTYPERIKEGSNCSSCRFNKKIDGQHQCTKYDPEKGIDLRGQPVNERNCCGEWDAPGTLRAWEKETTGKKSYLPIRTKKNDESGASSGGHWITLSSKDKAGDKHGNVHVFIDDAGHIAKGPEGLRGKRVSELRSSHSVEEIHGRKHPETGTTEGPKEASSHVASLQSAIQDGVPKDYSKPSSRATNERQRTRERAQRWINDWTEKASDADIQAAAKEMGIDTADKSAYEVARAVKDKFVADQEERVPKHAATRDAEERERYRARQENERLEREQAGKKPADPVKEAERDWKENGVRSKAFKSWFGDWENDPKQASKVVNEDGTPKVVYHGTSADINSFDTFGGRDLGSHFGNLEQAHDFSGEEGGTVYPVYLNIKKPLRLPDVERWNYDTLKEELAKHNIEVEKVPFKVEVADRAENYKRMHRRQREAIAKALESSGYDGIVYQNNYEGDKSKDSYIVFRPEQIKSAHNRGTFDANDPHIGKSWRAQQRTVLDVHDKAWDESKHPRVASGEHGGEFTSGGTGAAGSKPAAGNPAEAKPAKEKPKEQAKKLFADHLAEAVDKLDEDGVDRVKLNEEVYDQADAARERLTNQLEDLVAYVRKSETEGMDEDMQKRVEPHLDDYESEIESLRDNALTALDGVRDAFDDLAYAMDHFADDPDHIEERRAGLEEAREEYQEAVTALGDGARDALKTLFDSIRDEVSNRNDEWEKEADEAADSLNSGYEDDPEGAAEDAKIANRNFAEAGNPYRLVQDEDGDWYYEIPDDEEEEDEEEKKQKHFKRQTAWDWLTKAWDSSKHPRGGDPANRGRFSHASGSSDSPTTPANRPRSDAATNPYPAPAGKPQSTAEHHAKPSSSADRSPLHKSLETAPMKRGDHLIGGESEKFLLTLEDGTKGVFKPASGEGRQARIGIPSGGNHIREVAASRVADVLGVNDLVPVTTFREQKGHGIGSMQGFVGGATLPFESKQPFDGEEDAARAAVFDYLIGNLDRHWGNWGEKDGELILWDNGLSFPESYHEHDVFNVAFWQNAYEKNLKLPDLSAWEDRWEVLEYELKQTGLSDKAIALTKQRFDALTSGKYKRISELPSLVDDGESLGDMVFKYSVDGRQGRLQRVRTPYPWEG